MNCPLMKGTLSNKSVRYVILLAYCIKVHRHKSLNMISFSPAIVTNEWVNVNVIIMLSPSILIFFVVPNLIRAFFDHFLQCLSSSRLTKML